MVAETQSTPAADAAEQQPQVASPPLAETESTPAVDAAEQQPQVLSPLTPQPASAFLEVPVPSFVKPEKPKKSVSSYWIYSNALREQVSNELKEKNDGKCTFGDLAKEVSARWKALSAEGKKPYEDQVAADKIRYETEMKAYNAICDPAAALRAKYADLIPKRPASLYILFCQDEKQKEKAATALQAEDKDASATLVSKKLQEMWKLIDPADRIAYQQEQMKEQLAFLEKQKAWQSMPEFIEVEKAEKTQEDMRKAVEAAVAQKDAEEKAKVERENRMARKRASKGPTKSDTPPVTKNARTSKASMPEPVSPQIDPKILEEAVKEGLDAGLKNLAVRPEILSSGKSARAILNALKASKGLVNPAKRALLGQ